MSTKIVDDQDPSVKYSPGWSLAGSTHEFDNTTSETNVAGMTASLQFSGTSIKVFGTITNIITGTSPTSSYSIDGGAASSFIGIPQVNTQYKVLFFQSAPLSDGNHTLVVTNTGNSTALLYLDFFEITLSTSSASTPGTPAISTSTTVKAASSGESTPSDMISSSLEHSEFNSSTGITIVVGSILGGLLVICILSFLFLYFFRNRKHTNTGGSRSLPPSLILQPLVSPRQLAQITPSGLSQINSQNRSLSELPSQRALNPIPSERPQSGDTNSPSGSRGSQSHSPAEHEQTICPESDIGLTAIMRDALSSVPSNHDITAAPEADNLNNNPLVHPASSAQFDMSYDPPPRYSNNR